MYIMYIMYMLWQNSSALASTESAGREDNASGTPQHYTTNYARKRDNSRSFELKRDKEDPKNDNHWP